MRFAKSPSSTGRTIMTHRERVVRAFFTLRPFPRVICKNPSNSCFLSCKRKHHIDMSNVDIAVNKTLGLWSLGTLKWPLWVALKCS